MHKFVKIGLAVAGGALLFGAAVVPASATTQSTTSADITCDVVAIHQYLDVTVRAWGSGYEPNSDLVVDETVTLDRKPWQAKRVTLRSSPAGDWSTPKDTYHTRLSGKYELTVAVSSPSGKPLGSATDACSI